MSLVGIRLFGFPPRRGDLVRIFMPALTFLIVRDITDRTFLSLFLYCGINRYRKWYLGHWRSIWLVIKKNFSMNQHLFLSQDSDLHLFYIHRILVAVKVGQGSDQASIFRQ